MRIAITGGAGFIGSHVAEALLHAGHDVVALDALDGQVHEGGWPAWLAAEVERIQGDVRDRCAVERALRRADAVVHLAAAVGVAQSQYQIRRYMDCNVVGTATLMEVVAGGATPVRRVVLAGSMTSYGEGPGWCGRCGRVRPAVRSEAEVRGGQWEPRCPHCGAATRPVPVREDDALAGTGIYAMTKRMQEEIVRSVAATYGVEACVLRLFNVYGPRQSLANPYTGVAAIFLSRLRNGRPPVIYEDGRQSRDFVYVGDVARAILAALTHPRAPGQVFNIGSGQGTRIADLARRLARACAAPLSPRVTGLFRRGDIRHCTADIRRAGEVLGWKPETSLDAGLERLIAWAARQPAIDRFAQAEEELRTFRLLVAGAAGQAPA